MAVDPLASFLTPATVAALEANAPPEPKKAKVVYVGPFAAGVEIAETGQWANPGAPVDVAEDLAERLLVDAESWAKPNTKAARAAKERFATLTETVSDGTGVALPPYDPENPGPHEAPGTESEEPTNG